MADARTAIEMTDRSRHVLALANQAAQLLSCEYIGTEHLLLGISREGSGVGAHTLKSRGIQYERLKAKIERLGPPPKVRELLGGSPSDKVGITPSVDLVLRLAEKNARELNHQAVGTEHLLLGLLDQRDSVACQVIMNMGASLETLRADVFRLLGADDPDLTDDQQIDVRVSDYQDALREAVILARDEELDIVAAFAHVMAKRRGHV